MKNSKFVLLLAIAAIAWLALVGILVADADATVPTRVSHTVGVKTKAVAEDACAILVVVEYEGGLDGSLYRCAGPDRKVVER